jgi:DNA-binding NarL/FixJ family response regulator
MGSPRWPVERLAEEVALLGGRGLPREQYYAELAARLRRVVDSDATCWHTLDPQTRVMTSDAPHELIERGIYTSETAGAAGRLLVRSEYFVEDLNTFARLARRRTPVGILGDAARGQPERSARYRDLLAPSGIPFELRAAFVSRGRAWGAVHIARREENGDFSRADADALAHVAGAIADGIRTSLRFDAARRAQDNAPGLVVLDAANGVELITAPARELLDALRSPVLAESDETPPTPLLALASFTRRGARDAGPRPEVVAVPSASGWITLHASLPEGRAEGQVAIVLERANSKHAAAVRLETHGVTAREREVATLLAQGLSNPELRRS